MASIPVPGRPNSESGATSASAPAQQTADGAEVTEVAHNGTLALLEDGATVALRIQSNWMRLTLDASDPSIASAVAFFGLGTIVLPFVGGLRDVQGKQENMFSYHAHDRKGSADGLHLFSEKELKERFGLADIAFKMKELTLSADNLETHIKQTSEQVLKREVRDISKWRESANTALKMFQRRSALSYLGLMADASDADISKVYKKLALELHPDKGGDADKFHTLQKMRERTLETNSSTPAEAPADDDMDCDSTDKRDVALKRWEVHRSIVQLWEEVKQTRDEINVTNATKQNSQEVFAALRTFLSSFLGNEMRTENGNILSFETKLGHLAKMGAEIIAVSSVLDSEATHSILAAHLGTFLASKGYSVEARRMYIAVLRAIKDVKFRVDYMLAVLEKTSTQTSKPMPLIPVGTKVWYKPQSYPRTPIFTTFVESHNEDATYCLRGKRHAKPGNVFVEDPQIAGWAHTEAPACTGGAKGSARSGDAAPIEPIEGHIVADTFASASHKDACDAEIPPVSLEVPVDVEIPPVSLDVPASNLEVQPAARSSLEAAIAAEEAYIVGLESRLLEASLEVAISNSSAVAEAPSSEITQCPTPPEDEIVFTFAPPPFQLGPYQMHLRLIDRGTWEEVQADLCEGLTNLGTLRGTYIRRGVGAFCDACCGGFCEQDSPVSLLLDENGSPAGFWKDRVSERASLGGLVILESMSCQDPVMHRVAPDLIHVVLQCLGGPMKRVTLAMWVDSAASVAPPGGTVGLRDVCVRMGFQCVSEEHPGWFLEVGASKKSGTSRQAEKGTSRTDAKVAKRKHQEMAYKENSVPTEPWAKQPRTQHILGEVNGNLPTELSAKQAKVDIARPLAGVCLGNVALASRVPRNSWDKLTPRMCYALRAAAAGGVIALEADASRFTSGTRGGEYWGCKCFSPRLQQNVFKAFVMGFANIVSIISELLQCQRTPSADVVTQLISPFSGKPAEELRVDINKHFVSHFFGVGGTVESVLLAVIQEASVFYEACESANGVEFSLFAEGHHALPVHMLDGDFEFVRSVLIPEHQ